MKRKRILMISDHPLSCSGVGTQARYLIAGLVNTGKYEFRCLGAAIKHTNYDVVNLEGKPPGPNDPCIIKPIDGFGNPELIRYLLVTEKPDAILLFTDPRFFQHIFEVEDEIHQVCPILYNYLWDNDPFPEYNQPIFDCVDLFNCISHHTYNNMKQRFPEKVNYTPHGYPDGLFFPLQDEVVKQAKEKMFGAGGAEKFVCFWANRNARRKNPGDLLKAWGMFAEKLEKNYGHRNIVLLMHTDPNDENGPNLHRIIDLFKLHDVVAISTDHVPFDQMNVLHNISDFSINISLAEGSGCGTKESMFCGKPIIVQKTGGLTCQVVNQIDGTINGIALDPDVTTLVGNQQIPYIYEDLVRPEKVADALYELYEWGPEKRKEVGMKAREYATNWFSLSKTVQTWDESIEKTIETWKQNYNRWKVVKI